MLNPIRTGGQNFPLRVFAKYIKNGLANLHETLCLLRPIYMSSFKIKSLKIDHSLLPWKPINGGVFGKKHDRRGKFFKNFSDSSQMMLKLGRNMRWVEIL